MPAVPGIAHEQIDMDVVVMVAVATRSEHGVELVAGARDHRLEESALASASLPPALIHADLLAARKAEEHAFSPPLDVVDGAARIVAPIVEGFRTGHHPTGLFFKDYRPAPW